MADVVRVRVYVTDISRADEVGLAHGEAFGDIRPVMTMVEVCGLVDPRMLVEIEAVALVLTAPCCHDGQAAVAQLAEQRAFNPKVVGSIPTGGMRKSQAPQHLLAR